MHGQKESVYVRSTGNITGILAFVGTVITLPVVWYLTLGWVEKLASFYSATDGFIAVVSLGWLVMLGVLLFSIMRLGMTALFSAIALFFVLYFSRDRD